MSSLAKHYDSFAAAKTYAPEWQAANYAHGDPARPGKSFSMIMPPPNVTGSLHMGHALNNTLQDVLARYRRMDGDNVCWIPGLDHASIAVHWLVEKALAAEGTDRRAIGREAFLARAHALKEDVKRRITNQQQMLALSCDWQRQCFTLDEGPSRAVTEAFVKLHEDGLIYRDERLVNWDPVSQTSVSDLEVVYEEGVQAELFEFAYPYAEGEGDIVVATTRPETMLGDAAVAVHPDDSRYRHLIGRELQHPFLDRKIPVVADAVLVDPEFGTGAVKITPAHDFNDFEVGRRHRLPAINLLRPDGTLNEQAGPFAGQSVAAAREAVVAELERMNLLRGRKPHVLSRGRSERSGAIIEPYLSTQWYVRTKPLRTPAVAAVQRGAMRFVPAAWENTYFSWLGDIRDWCISRQLWWGHRIPAWTCDGCKALHVLREAPSACPACDGRALTRDPDVLDTWFSSALWPFSTQGWPERGVLSRYYPTQTLVTSFDIIFFWVARMMMLGQYLTGSVPFADVYIHALIRDAKGEKMSKTKGNVVDPLEMIERYGVDAFRFTLVAFAGQGRDVRWDEARAGGYQKFLNKIWQALRFVALKIEGAPPAVRARLASERAQTAAPAPFDAWLRARTHHCTQAVRDALDNYRFNEAAEAIYHFAWNELCDWSLEVAKGVTTDDAATPGEQAAALGGLLGAFDVLARLLHPITPYLAEELYQTLRRIDPGTAAEAPAHVVVAPFPRVPAAPAAAAAEAEAEAAFVVQVVRALRRVRADFQVPVNQIMDVRVRAPAAPTAALARHARVLLHLAKSRAVAAEGADPRASAFEFVDGAELVVPLSGLVDLEQEKARLGKIIDKARREAGGLAAMLGREGFVARAPAAVVAEKRQARADAEELAERLSRALARL